jgi:hypothetical protein
MLKITLPLIVMAYNVIMERSLACFVNKLPTHGLFNGSIKSKHHFVSLLIQSATQVKHGNKTLEKIKNRFLTT